MRRVSSGVRGGIPEILTGTSLPDSSTTGKLPGERIRSLTLADTLSMVNKSAGVGIGLASGLGAEGTAAGLAAVSNWIPFRGQRRRTIQGLHAERQIQT